MSREEYDPSIEPSWKLDRSLGIWSYQDAAFETSIFEAPFPKDKEGFALVSLPALSAASGDWISALSHLPKLKDGCRGWLWKLDLGLTPMKAPVTDEGQLRSSKWALAEFNRQVWALHRRKSLGVILYQAKAQNTGFYWDLEQLEQFISWLGDMEPDTLAESTLEKAKACLLSADLLAWREFAQTSLWAQLYSLFILSQYWHYLASALEEDCPALIELDVEGLTLQDQVFLLSRALFDHVVLIGHGAHPKLCSLQKNSQEIIATRAKPASVALLVPEKMSIDKAFLIAKAMEKLDQSGIDYRLILETNLVFEWQEVEKLIIFAESITDQSLRSLRGFKAASGHVYAIGENPKVDSIVSEWPSEFADLLLTS